MPTGHDVSQRRFSCLDRVRFRHDVSLLCRRIGDVFHASIVFVKATRCSYHTWCNNNILSTNVRHHASDILIIMYQHTEGHNRDHTPSTSRTLTRTQASLSTANLTHIQTDTTEIVDLEPHTCTHTNTHRWNCQFIKHIVTETNTIEAWSRHEKRRLYAVTQAGILHQVSGL